MLNGKNVKDVGMVRTARLHSNIISGKEICTNGLGTKMQNAQVTRTHFDNHKIVTIFNNTFMMLQFYKKISLVNWKGQRGTYSFTLIKKSSLYEYAK